MDNYICDNDSVEAEPKPDLGRIEIATSKPGLRLRVTSTDTREFIWYYTHPYELGKNGNKRRCALVLGQYHRTDKKKGITWGGALDALEDGKRKVKAKLDPTPAKKVQDKPKTIGELCDRFYDQRILTMRERPENVKQIIETNIRPSIGALKVKDMQIEHLTLPARQLYLRDKKAHAKTVFKIVGQMIKWAKTNQLIDDNAMLGVTLADAGMKIRTRPRQRYLKKKEMAVFFNALTNSQVSEVKKLGLRLLLLTGCRTQELRLNTWDNVDWKKRVLTIPFKLLKMRDKLPSEDDFLIPLAPAAMAIIDRLHEINGDTGYLLGDPTTGEVVGEATLRNSTYTVANKAGVASFCPHDLRRTCRTWLGKIGIEEKICERYIGHADDVITETYSVNKYMKKRRRAAEKLAAKLSPMMGPGTEGIGQEATNVTSITQVA